MTTMYKERKYIPKPNMTIRTQIIMTKNSPEVSGSLLVGDHYDEMEGTGVRCGRETIVAWLFPKMKDTNRCKLRSDASTSTHRCIHFKILNTSLWLLVWLSMALCLYEGVRETDEAESYLLWNGLDGDGEIRWGIIHCFSNIPATATLAVIFFCDGGIIDC